jgi:hypothetical protein
MFARLRSRIEAAAPAPRRLVMRYTGSNRDRADLDVAVIDKPAFFASVVVAAAGENRHALLKRGPALMIKLTEITPDRWAYPDQRKSRSRASSTMCSPDKTELTNGGCGEV